MKFWKNRFIWRFKWHTTLICAAIIVVILLTLLTDIFRTPEPGEIPQLIWLLLGVAALTGVSVILVLTFKILGSMKQTAARFEKTADMLDKIRSELTKINQNTRLSETAKMIAFRDADRQTLREAVFDKLQQKDFDTTYQIIDEIADSTGYTELAEQLRAQADKYRDATDQERINQVISHIENLFENHQWAKAGTLIERLIKAHGDNENVKGLRQKLVDKKEERKKILLTSWDDAVKRQATDRSLEILRELDSYLTPNEGLALQEAARDVFRTKLHNLGVQFSLAVSAKQWEQALQSGQQIIHDFPNSRMAQEIRERWDVLKQKAPAAS